MLGLRCGEIRPGVIHPAANLYDTLGAWNAGR